MTVAQLGSFPMAQVIIARRLGALPGGRRREVLGSFQESGGPNRGSKITAIPSKGQSRDGIPM